MEHVRCDSWGTRVPVGKRRGGLPGHIVAGILDVVLGRFLEPRQLGVPQGPFGAGRRTDHQAARRDFGVFGDQCPGPDDTVVSDHGSVHQHGTHADQNAIVNGTAVEHDVVTDRDVVTDDQGIRVVGHVEQREVLDVGTMADPNIVDVAADDTVEPHAGFGFDDYVARRSPQYLR